MYTTVNLWGILGYFINVWGGEIYNKDNVENIIFIILIPYYLLTTYYLPIQSKMWFDLHIFNFWNTFIYSLIFFSVTIYQMFTMNQRDNFHFTMKLII